jgi:hypothetical protein
VCNPGPAFCSGQWDGALELLQLETRLVQPTKSIHVSLRWAGFAFCSVNHPKESGSTLDAERLAEATLSKAAVCKEVMTLLEDV